MKRLLSKLFDNRSEKLTIALALLSVGFTIVIFGLSSYTDIERSQNNAEKYVNLLRQEIYLNYEQASLFNGQYQKDNNVTFIPSYRETIFQSGMNNGQFYEIDSYSQTRIIAAYALVEIDNKSVNQYSNTEEQAQRNAALNGQAIALKSQFEKLSEEISVSNNSMLLFIFLIVSIIGAIVLLFSALSIARLILKT